MFKHKEHEEHETPEGLAPGIDEQKETKPQRGAWQQFTFNLANLFKVKTIITLGVVIVFLVLVCRGADIREEFLITLTAIVTYYFCRNDGKEEKDGKL